LWDGAVMTDDTFLEKAPEKLSVWGHKPVVTGLPTTVHQV
jgi:hypothetical protein